MVRRGWCDVGGATWVVSATWVAAPFLGAGIGSGSRGGDTRVIVVVNDGGCGGGCGLLYVRTSVNITKPSHLVGQSY